MPRSPHHCLAGSLKSPVELGAALADRYTVKREIGEGATLFYVVASVDGESLRHEEAVRLFEESLRQAQGVVIRRRNRRCKAVHAEHARKPLFHNPLQT